MPALGAEDGESGGAGVRRVRGPEGTGAGGAGAGAGGDRGRRGRAGAWLPCLGCSLSARTVAAASGLAISARSRTRSVSRAAQDTNCMVLPTLPRRPHPLPPAPSAAAAAESAEAGARRRGWALGVAEVPPRGSRLRSAEHRRRLPRAEPPGPPEEPPEEHWEDCGPAARQHTVRGARRRRRGPCAPRRGGALCWRG